MCASTCAAEQKPQLMKFSFSNNRKKHNPPRRLWRKGLLNKGPHHLTIQNHEPCKYRTRQTGFSSSPFPACSSFRACASCKSAFVPLRTARPVCKRNGWKAFSKHKHWHGQHLHAWHGFRFLPGCAGARFDSLPLCISCWRWTCSLSWWAAIRNGG